MFAHLREQSSLSAFSDWLWKRRVFTWKCLWDLWLAGVQQLWFWGKHSGIVSRQLHQQLRSTLAKTAGLCSGPDHRGPASGSGIYSCWGLQWQRLLGVFLFCLLEEFLAKGILFGARLSTLALGGGGAGVLESGTWGSTSVLVQQCICSGASASAWGVGVCTSWSQGLSPWDSPQWFVAPGWGDTVVAQTVGCSNGTPWGWWVKVLPLAPGHRVQSSSSLASAMPGQSHDSAPKG